MNALPLEESDIYSGELILVNKYRPLHYPDRVKPLLCGFGDGGIRLQRQCAEKLRAALDFVGAGERIVPVSGWRSMEEQTRIYGDCLESDGAEFTEKYVALPGCSEHQTGLAIDLGERRESIDFIRPAFPYEGICQSFREAAARFGFIERYGESAESITEIAWEPWHFRYVGEPHAAIITGLGLTLEEYHDFVRNYPYDGNHYVYICAGRAMELSYLPADDCGRAALPLDGKRLRSVSGNNIDGFVITQWR